MVPGVVNANSPEGRQQNTPMQQQPQQQPPQNPQ
jgi:hypothetical protein